MNYAHSISICLHFMFMVILIVFSSTDSGSSSMSSSSSSSESSAESNVVVDSSSTKNESPLSPIIPDDSSNSETSDRFELLQSVLQKLRYKMKSKRTASIHSNKKNKRMSTRYGWPVERNGMTAIECPDSQSGLTQLFPCPSRDSKGRYVCIDDHDLCDLIENCPRGEDEDKTVCMFHKMTLNFFKAIMAAVFDLSKSII